MKERYMLKCAVFLILTKIENNKEYVLIQRRYNTGIQDGKYDVSVSGHLEKNETLKEAIIRETKEELGIDVSIEDLSFVSTMIANFKGDEYLLITFSSNKFEGIPSIMEKDKCDDLIWVSLDELPKNIIETRQIMINDYNLKNNYSEYGFDKNI